jgi:hypothetical protein
MFNLLVKPYFLKFSGMAAFYTAIMNHFVEKKKKSKYNYLNTM